MKKTDVPGIIIVVFGLLIGFLGQEIVYAEERTSIVQQEKSRETFIYLTTAARVEKRQIEEDIVGTIKPLMRSTISARISGRIKQLQAVSGQKVQKGEVLLELEASDLQAKVEQARAVFEQADRDLRRFASLLKDRAVTEQDYESVMSKQRVAKASREEIEATLAYALVTAPFSGVVTQKFVDAGDTAAPGMPLLEIVSPGALRFEAEVPEALINFVKIGAQLEVSIETAKKQFPAQVAELVPAADPRSRTFLVKLDIPDPEGLFPGQFGRFRLPTGEAEALLIPKAALVRRGQLEIVFVVKNSQAELRLVRTGRLTNDQVEILAGLQGGEQVVISRPDLLSDGAKVVTRSTRGDSELTVPVTENAQ